MKPHFSRGFKNTIQSTPLHFSKGFAQKEKQHRVVTKPSPEWYEPTILRNEPVDGAESPTKDITGLFSGGLDEYVLGETVGKGSYATVRKARMKSSGLLRAIKSYNKKRLCEAHRVKCIQREIDILGRIQHPNLLNFYEAIKTHKHVYLITDFISGTSLSSLLKAKTSGTFNEHEAKRIFKQILSGISYCHSMNISHRDIKLENILIEHGGNVKVIDFGFASCTEPGENNKIFCGTPNYMAPEIVSRREYAGPPADIWALGVVLYVMLTGSFPFKGNTDKELFRGIIKGLSRVPGAFSVEGKDLIEKMMSVDPESRPSTEEISSHLWLSGE